MLDSVPEPNITLKFRSPLARCPQKLGMLTNLSKCRSGCQYRLCLQFRRISLQIAMQSPHLYANRYDTLSFMLAI